jgi:hypothetical protein
VSDKREVSDIRLISSPWKCLLIPDRRAPIVDDPVIRAMLLHSQAARSPNLKWSSSR